MTDPLLHTWSLNLGYAKRLVADSPDENVALQPAPGMNHAAWVLGHLACTADMLGSMIGLEPVCPDDWPALFDWNSSPSSDASRYPSKATLGTALEDAHARIAAADTAAAQAADTVRTSPSMSRAARREPGRTQPEAHDAVTNGVLDELLFMQRTRGWPLEK